MRRLATIFAMLLALSGCAGYETSATTAQPAAKTTRSEPAKPKADDLAKLACRHFWNTINDSRNGVIGEAELARKLREVFDRARYSETPGIAATATKFQRGIVNDDMNKFRNGIQGFTDACQTAGL